MRAAKEPIERLQYTAGKSTVVSTRSFCTLRFWQTILFVLVFHIENSKNMWGGGVVELTITCFCVALQCEYMFRTVNRAFCQCRTENVLTFGFSSVCK